MHDLVIRNGTIVDGTGAPAFSGDVAIDGGRVSVVGKVEAKGREEIDAAGLLVTPGFVDIHTHYDGQATWDADLAPSSWHGVTTVVMGNCGVGFAPAAPERHQWLIELMEGVEDIPGSALAEGLTWGWESFPEYLDVLEKMPRTVDVGTHVPHGAVRAYVMGERGARNEPATASDIAAMARIVEQGLKAGALGFSTSRTMLHKAKDGEVVPGTFAAKDELIGIGLGMKRAGHGVFEMASDFSQYAEEFDTMEELSRESGLPVTYALLQSLGNHDAWRESIRRTEAANARGGRITAQIALRGTGLLLNWRGTVHPFMPRPSWQAIAGLPWEQQLARLRDPAFKAQLLSEPPLPAGLPTTALGEKLFNGWSSHYRITDDPDYEPAAEDSIAALAAREGRDPAEYAYEVMLEDDGRGFIYLPLLNYSDGHLDHVRELLDHKDTLVSLSDGGAHCGTICDAASTTFMLTHWVRDRSRGSRLTLEQAVYRQTAHTADAYGLHDRGRLQPGMIGDVNLIDLARLRLLKPYLAFDLPAGGKRLLQKAEGYVATIKNGTVTFRDGEPTGARPGKLIRGPQSAPLKLAAE